MEEEPSTPPTPPPPTSPFWLKDDTNGPFLSTGFLVILLSTSAIALLALGLNHAFRPSSVKRGWDSLNIVLVLFAVICGLLGRKGHDNKNNNNNNELVKDRDLNEEVNVITPQHDQPNWYDHGNVTKLRRSSSSYPDLRQEILWYEFDPRPRYHDDFYAVYYGGSPIMSRTDQGSTTRPVIDRVETREDEKMRQTSPPSPSKTLPPAPAPLIRVRKPPRQENETSSHRRKTDGQTRKAQPSSQSKRKSKLQKRKSQERLNDLEQPPRQPPTLPPPPPPLPPPIRIIPRDKLIPKPVIKSTLVSDESAGECSDSPLSRIPPPPPPPPFKVPPWKFAVQGDYIRINNSTRRGGGGDESSEAEESPTGGKAMTTVFCSSSDVNTKADDFIARFKATLKLEKMNSFKQGQGIKHSPLGPDSRSNPHAMAIPLSFQS